MPRSLPPIPSLLQQRHLAKDLLKAWKADDPLARQRIRAGHPRLMTVSDQHLSAHPLKLADAQLVLAREYGFASWPKLKEHIEATTGRRQNEQAIRLARMVQAGDAAAVDRLLTRNPGLVTMDLAETNEHRALHFAVRRRDAPMVRRLMEAGADPRQGVYPLRESTSPRALAEDRGFDEIVTIFNEFEARRQAANPHPAVPTSPATGHQETTPDPLLTAIAQGDEQTVALIAKTMPERFRANPARKCGLLQVAVGHDQLTMVRLLLDLGCDPDDRHRLNHEEEILSQGEPLWLAAGEGRIEIAKLLLARGADVHAELYASGTALYRAYDNRDRAMIELLMAHGAQLDLDTAVLEGDETAVSTLLQGRTTIDPRTLGFAVLGGNPTVVKRCLELVPSWRDHSYQLLTDAMDLWRCGAHRRHRDFDHAAYVEILRFLLTAGANPNARGRWGYTPLHKTVVAGHIRREVLSTPEERVAFATLLLDHGAVLDIRDEEICSTPLAWAARWGRMELVELFLDRGAKLRLADDEPWATPLAWAQRKGHDAIEQLLRQRGA